MIPSLARKVTGSEQPTLYLVAPSASARCTFARGNSLCVRNLLEPVDPSVRVPTPVSELHAARRPQPPSCTSTLSSSAPTKPLLHTNQSLGQTNLWGRDWGYHDSCSATNRGFRRVRTRRSGMRRGWDDLWGRMGPPATETRRRRRRLPFAVSGFSGEGEKSGMCHQVTSSNQLIPMPVPYSCYQLTVHSVLRCQNLCLSLRLRMGGRAAVSPNLGSMAHRGACIWRHTAHTSSLAYSDREERRSCRSSLLLCLGTRPRANRLTLAQATHGRRGARTAWTTTTDAHQTPDTRLVVILIKFARGVFVCGFAPEAEASRDARD